MSFVHKRRYIAGILCYVLIANFSLVVGFGSEEDICSESTLSERLKTTFKVLKLGRTRNTKTCINVCCNKNKCDLALFRNGRCFGISCGRPNLCRSVLQNLRSTTSEIFKRSLQDTDDGGADFLPQRPEYSHGICRNRRVISHHIFLHGGKGVTNFRRLSHQELSWRQCNQKCCNKEDCSLAFVMTRKCYGVICPTDSGHCDSERYKRVPLHVEVALLHRRGYPSHVNSIGRKRKRRRKFGKKPFHSHSPKRQHTRHKNINDNLFGNTHRKRKYQNRHENRVKSAVRHRKTSRYHNTLHNYDSETGRRRPHQRKHMKSNRSHHLKGGKMLVTNVIPRDRQIRKHKKKYSVSRYHENHKSRKSQGKVYRDKMKHNQNRDFDEERDPDDEDNKVRKSKNKKLHHLSYSDDATGDDEEETGDDQDVNDSDGNDSSVDSNNNHHMEDDDKSEDDGEQTMPMHGSDRKNTNHINDSEDNGGDGDSGDVNDEDRSEDSTDNGSGDWEKNHSADSNDGGGDSGDVNDEDRSEDGTDNGSGDWEKNHSAVSNGGGGDSGDVNDEDRSEDGTDNGSGGDWHKDHSKDSEKRTKVRDHTENHHAEDNEDTDDEVGTSFDHEDHTDGSVDGDHGDVDMNDESNDEEQGHRHKSGHTKYTTREKNPGQERSGDDENDSDDMNSVNSNQNNEERDQKGSSKHNDYHNSENSVDDENDSKDGNIGNNNNKNEDSTEKDHRPNGGRKTGEHSEDSEDENQDGENNEQYNHYSGSSNHPNNEDDDNDSAEDFNHSEDEDNSKQSNSSHKTRKDNSNGEQFNSENSDNDSDDSREHFSNNGGHTRHRNGHSGETERKELHDGSEQSRDSNGDDHSDANGVANNDNGVNRDGHTKKHNYQGSHGWHQPGKKYGDNNYEDSGEHFSDTGEDDNIKHRDGHLEEIGKYDHRKNKDSGVKKHFRNNNDNHNKGHPSKSVKKKYHHDGGRIAHGDYEGSGDSYQSDHTRDKLKGHSLNDKSEESLDYSSNQQDRYGGNSHKHTSKQHYTMSNFHKLDEKHRYKYKNHETHSRQYKQQHDNQDDRVYLKDRIDSKPPDDKPPKSDKTLEEVEESNDNESSDDDQKTSQESHLTMKGNPGQSNRVYKSHHKSSRKNTKISKGNRKEHEILDSNEDAEEVEEDDGALNDGSMNENEKISASNKNSDDSDDEKSDSSNENLKKSSNNDDSVEEVEEDDDEMASDDNKDNTEHSESKKERYDDRGITDIMKDNHKVTQHSHGRQYHHEVGKTFTKKNDGDTMSHHERKGSRHDGHLGRKQQSEKGENIPGKEQGNASEIHLKNVNSDKSKKTQHRKHQSDSDGKATDKNNNENKHSDGNADSSFEPNNKKYGRHDVHQQTGEDDLMNQKYQNNEKNYESRRNHSNRKHGVKEGIRKHTIESTRVFNDNVSLNNQKLHHNHSIKVLLHQNRSKTINTDKLIHNPDEQIKHKTKLAKNEEFRNWTQTIPENTGTVNRKDALKTANNGSRSINQPLHHNKTSTSENNKEKVHNVSEINIAAGNTDNTMNFSSPKKQNKTPSAEKITKKQHEHVSSSEQNDVKENKVQHTTDDENAPSLTNHDKSLYHTLKEIHGTSRENISTQDIRRPAQNENLSDTTKYFNQKTHNWEESKNGDNVDNNGKYFNQVTRAWTKPAVNKESGYFKNMTSHLTSRDNPKYFNQRTKNWMTSIKHLIYNVSKNKSKVQSTLTKEIKANVSAVKFMNGTMTSSEHVENSTLNKIGRAKDMDSHNKNVTHTSSSLSLTRSQNSSLPTHSAKKQLIKFENNTVNAHKTLSKVRKHKTDSEDFRNEILKLIGRDPTSSPRKQDRKISSSKLPKKHNNSGGNERLRNRNQLIKSKSVVVRPSSRKQAVKKVRKWRKKMSPLKVKMKISRPQQNNIKKSRQPTKPQSSVLAKTNVPSIEDRYKNSGLKYPTVDGSLTHVQYQPTANLWNKANKVYETGWQDYPNPEQPMTQPTQPPLVLPTPIQIYHSPTVFQLPLAIPKSTVAPTRGQVPTSSQSPSRLPTLGQQLPWDNRQWDDWNTLKNWETFGSAITTPSPNSERFANDRKIVPYTTPINGGGVQNNQPDHLYQDWKKTNKNSQNSGENLPRKGSVEDNVFNRWSKPTQSSPRNKLTDSNPGLPSELVKPPQTTPRAVVVVATPPPLSTIWRQTPTSTTPKPTYNQQPYGSNPEESPITGSPTHGVQKLPNTSPSTTKVPIPSSPHLHIEPTVIQRGKTTSEPKSIAGINQPFEIDEIEPLHTDAPRNITTKDKQAHIPASCYPGEIMSEMTLENGLDSGNYTKLGEIPEMDVCIAKCCQLHSCDVAIQMDNICFAITCHSKDMCTIKSTLGKSSHHNLCFISKGKKAEKKLNDFPNDVLDVQDFCQPDEALGLQWHKTLAGTLDEIPCPKKATGKANRECSVESQWFAPDFTDCVTTSYNDLYKKAKRSLLEGDISSVLNDLALITTRTIDNSLIFGGDLKIIAELLKSVSGEVTRGKRSSVQDIQNFLTICSNILDDSNKQEWENIQKTSSGADAIMNDIQTFTSFTPDWHKNMTLTSNNLLVQTTYHRSKDEIVLPDYTNRDADIWDGEKDSIKISPTSQSKKTKFVMFSYKSLPTLLPATINGKQSNSEVNSKILGVLARPRSGNGTQLEITLHHLKEKGVNPRCVFWDFDFAHSGKGSWSTNGCYLLYTDKTFSKCRCDHLGDHALLMDIVDNDVSQVTSKEQLFHNREMAAIWICVPILVVFLIGALYTVFTWSKPPVIARSRTVNEKSSLLPSTSITTEEIRRNYRTSPSSLLYTKNLSKNDNSWSFLCDKRRYDKDTDSGIESHDCDESGSINSEISSEEILSDHDNCGQFDLITNRTVAMTTDLSNRRNQLRLAAERRVFLRNLHRAVGVENISSSYPVSLNSDIVNCQQIERN